MIFDKLENLSAYPLLKDAADFVLRRGLDGLEIGKHSLNGENYANVMEYQSKTEDGALEAHVEYIDVQCVITGCEYVWVSKLDKCKLSKEYDEIKDFALYEAEDYDILYLEKGYFAAFFPDDTHRPAVAVKGAENVKKCVFKIKVI